MRREGHSVTEGRNYEPVPQLEKNLMLKRSTKKKITNLSQKKNILIHFRIDVVTYPQPRVHLHKQR